ncbi:MAG: hypothetical protein GY736_11230 [Sphingomonas sp.]|nr:hypothetical protein [Sphingomonas sp.]MCP4026860.1 hypothetical protein [Sphingomonas sp.]
MQSIVAKAWKSFPTLRRIDRAHHAPPLSRMRGRAFITTRSTQESDMADVTDPTHEPESYTDLPMQPTGSGPADLEVAYEQMRLAEEAEGTTGGVPAAAVADAAVPVSDAGAIAENEAHLS